MLQKLLIIDVETTGFDPKKNTCVEIGAVLLDESLREIQEFTSLIALPEGAQIDDGAMKINRIRPTDLADAAPEKEVVERFHRVFRLDEVVPLLGGWNVWFDVSFVRQLYRKAQRPWPFVHRLIDVQSIISFHNSLEGLSQDQAIRRFLAERQEHRALPDARHTARLFRLFALQYSSPARQKDILREL
jgi:DNA polymerase III epsilon subunit-like protein